MSHINARSRAIDEYIEEHRELAMSGRRFYAMYITSHEICEKKRIFRHNVSISRDSRGFSVPLRAVLNLASLHGASVIMPIMHTSRGLGIKLPCLELSSRDACKK